MTEFAIEIKGLRKIYQKTSKTQAKEALKGVDLCVKKGSFFGLLGPNGAGKSTIINILAGLVKKTQGSVKIAGIDLDENELAAKFKIGIVPQELVIDPFFTVRETLEIYAGYFGVRKENRKTDEIIAALGLQDKADARPRSLSGGMKRRLLVAKALVNDPEILVLDEPTAGVDVELRSQLWEYVRGLNQKGKTIVLTTHYLEEAEELCDEIAVINSGEVIAHDRKENLMALLGDKELTIVFAEGTNCSKIKVPEGLRMKQCGENQLSLIYDPKKMAVSEIFAEIAKSNAVIEDVSTSQPDLEEVFKHLINR